MPSTRRLGLFAMLAAVGAALPGCGPDFPDTIPVTGTVTLDARPVAGAAVVFTPEEGQQATATTDDSGRFQLSTFQLGDGALPGEHRVTITKTVVEPGDEEKITFLIPKKYGNLATTELTCNVQEEMGPVSFDLASGPEPRSKEEIPSSQADEPTQDTSSADSGEQPPQPTPSQ